MVVKTELCVFTDYRIYPGRGRKFAARDGKTFMFISHKTQSLFHQRIKPVKLTWTQAWRRKNKKGTQQEVNRRKNRKTQKFQKAIVGMSLEDIRKKKAQRPEIRAATEVAKNAAKEKQKKAAGAKGGAKQAPKGKDKQTKQPQVKKAADKRR